MRGDDTQYTINENFVMNVLIKIEQEDVLGEQHGSTLSWLVREDLVEQVTHKVSFE